jgi:predicted RNase H-like HicB family nuclease
MQRYAIIIEPGERNYSAYVPDLPGCVATGRTEAEVKDRLSAAIDMHLAGLQEDGLEVPLPSSLCDYLEVETAA